MDSDQMHFSLFNVDSHHQTLVIHIWHYTYCSIELKIQQTLAHDIQKHWTAVLALLSLISMISPLEIEPATPECRAETLPLTTSSHHTSNTKPTSHGNCEAS